MLEKIVTSLEVSKKLDIALKKANIKVEPLFWWYGHSESDCYFVEKYGFLSEDCMSQEECPALTASEIGEILKKYELETIWFPEKNKFGSFQTCNGIEPFYADSEADSRALLLCYLIDNGLLNNNKPIKNI